MPDFPNKFSQRSHQNLLQLWRGRNALADFYMDPLRDELDRRGLSKEVEEISEQVSSRDIYRELPEGPQTHLNLLVHYWWIRELSLGYKTRNGISIDATITSAQRTGFRARSASRTELLYSYEFQGDQYTGRVVRDLVFDTASGDSLACNNHPGEKLPILINQEGPEISYYPSGGGAFDPIVGGFQALFVWAVIIGLIRLLLLCMFR
jgi:hypothetical protein